MSAGITLVGRIVRDAAVRDAGSGRVCELCVACDGFRSSDDSTFWKVEVWGKPVEWVGDWVKGQLVEVHGQVEDDSYADKEGKKVTRFKVNAWLTKPLTRPDPEANNPQSQPPAPQQTATQPPPEDDIPF